MIHFLDSELDAFIAEDVPYFDLTAETLGISGRAKIVFFAREYGVVSGAEEAARICEKLRVYPRVLKPSGLAISKEEPILEALGDAKGILKAWKPSQNILEYSCAVATQTAKIVKIIKDISPNTNFATTRKTIPGTKKLSLKAVLNGGGYAHRLGLSESVLVFPQYAKLAKLSIEECVAKIKSRTIEHKVAVETKTVKQAISAANAGADIVQCDKLSAEEIREVVEAIKAINQNIAVIATGGINIQNVASYAASKPNVIVSSSVYYVKPFDVKVEITPL